MMLTSCQFVIRRVTALLRRRPALLLSLLLLAPSAHAQQTAVTGLPDIIAVKGVKFQNKASRPVVVPPSAPQAEAPVALEAKGIAYDQKKGIVIAEGSVMVEQGGYLLSADKLTYYQQANLVLADGNVSILEPSGNIYFAEHAELKDDMKRGVIDQFQARMADDSVFAASKADRVTAGLTQLKKAVYTPCRLCKGVAPFWQIKATEMTVDELEETISYENPRMELAGIPVLYAPYLSQPTPDSAAKSGFLIPKYSSGRSLSSMVKIPYYWRISEDKEVTLTPWIMSSDSPLLEGNYRQLSDGGDYQVLFSGSNPKKRDVDGNEMEGHEFRGHIYAKGEEELGEYSRVGFDINRSTDDTYIRRYGFGSQASLFSTAYAEAAQKRNYAAVQALAIQGLRATDDPSTTPLVLPTVSTYYETEPNRHGIRVYSSANAQSLTREIGADQRRLSTTIGATLPYITENGQVLKATVNARQDLYQVDHVAIAGVTDNYRGNVARTIPQAAVEWRYPLIRAMEKGAMTVEPILLGVAQPNGGNPMEISNEDNTLIELTDTNIFSIDRMPGFDSVDSGARVAYGVRSEYVLDGDASVDALLGQAYSANNSTPFPNSNTLGDNSSDYIGRLGLNAQDMRLSYRFAVDRNHLDFNRSEVSAYYMKPWLNSVVSYRSIVNNRYLEDSEEAILYADTPLTDEWKIYGSARRDLVLNQMIAGNTGLVYHNECFNVAFEGLRTYTRDRDIMPDTRFTVQVAFKNLGDFSE